MIIISLCVSLASNVTLVIIEDSSSRAALGSNITPLLILYGNSGSGKSTAVELLCKENNIEIVDWDEEAMMMTNATTTAAAAIGYGPSSSKRRYSAFPSTAGQVYDVRSQHDSSMINSFYDLDITGGEGGGGNNKVREGIDSTAH